MKQKIMKWLQIFDPSVSSRSMRWMVVGVGMISFGIVSFGTSAIADVHPSLLEFAQGSSLSRPQKEALATSDLASQLVRDLTRSQVIYLGETHDSEVDHRLQLEILTKLHQQNPNLMVGMEMFQRPYQSVLDRYLKGELTEAEFLDRTEYKTRWGFPWSLYAPIVQFAKAQKIPIVALNTPAEVTRKVSRKGLASLEPSERRFIPPISEIEIGPPVYRDRIAQVFTEMHQGRGNSKGVDAFFQAQVLWDETMADRISQTFMRSPDPKPQLVILVGQGHLLYGDGIPRRVQRRLQSRLSNFSQTTILLNPDPSFASLEPTTKNPIGDWIWRSSVPKNP